jgi:hypothetical protein
MAALRRRFLGEGIALELLRMGRPCGARWWSRSTADLGLPSSSSPAGMWWWCSSCVGFMSELDRVGVGGCVACGGALWCASGVVRPFV